MTWVKPSKHTQHTKKEKRMSLKITSSCQINGWVLKLILLTCTWIVELSNALNNSGRISERISSCGVFSRMTCRFSRIVTVAWIDFGAENTALQEKSLFFFFCYVLFCVNFSHCFITIKICWQLNKGRVNLPECRQNECFIFILCCFGCQWERRL